MHIFRGIIATGLVVMAMFGLTACGGISEGPIVGKNFVPAHTETQYMPIYAGQTCANNICTPIYTQMPYDVNVGDAWYLSLKDKNGKKGTVSVSEEIYNVARNGYLYSKKQGVVQQ